MANAHIVFGVHKREGVIDFGFTSQLVASGANSAPMPAGFNIIQITPDANVYVSFGPNTSVANAATDPRMWIPGGTTVKVSAVANTIVAVAVG